MSVTKAEMESAIQTAIDQAVAPLATKDELAEAVAKLATKDELRETEERLRRYIEHVDRGLRIEIQHSTNVIVEQLASYVRVLDDKYKQLPDDVKLVRADLDAHVADLKAHDR